MLSPGKDHELVPRDYWNNLRWREMFLVNTNSSPDLREGCMEVARQDILWWIDTWVWQLNPKKVDKEIGPFITWDWQRAAIRETLDTLLGQQPDDILWEKSREMGATWLALIISVWLCLFHPNKRVIMVSHSEEAVTKSGDEGTLFAKIQFILDYLPDWMKRDVKKWKKGYRFANRSTISALASTGRSGVGDRVTFVLLDEFSKQRDAYDIWGQTADTGPRLVIGTHYATGGCYYDLAMQEFLIGEAHPIKKIVMHWSQHPDKNKGLYRFNGETNKVEVLDTKYDYGPDFSYVMTGKPGGRYPGLRSPWYDRECARRKNPRDVAMHLDIDPQGASSQFFDPTLIHTLKSMFALPPVWEGDLHFDRETAKPICPVSLPNGNLKLWVNLTYQDKPPSSRYAIALDVAAGTGATPSCASIFDVYKGEKIGRYSNPFIEPREFAAFAVSLCYFFCDAEGIPAELIWETPGPGIALGQRVMELGFRNVWWRTVETSIMKNTAATPGWVNNPSALRLAMEEYRAALQTRQFVNRDGNALDECLFFVYAENGNVEHGKARATNDPSGARENHSDHAISDALVWKLAKGKQIRDDKKPLQKAEPGSLAHRRLLAKREEERALAWV